MTSLPDWLVERAALDEVAPTSRDRVEQADPRELAERIAALRVENAAELASYPAGAAVPQIEGRIAGETRRLAAHRRTRRLALLGTASAAAAVVVVAGLALHRTPSVTDDELPANGSQGEGIRVKGSARLLAFRQVGDQVERLEQDAIAHAGDLIQLRYTAGGEGYGVIASIDGAGVVTLHHPVSEDAPPEATALSAKPTALPHAYALDDAPEFERFFFITADTPLDVPHSLAALRALAARRDSATATLDLPAGLHQWSLRLRKSDRNPKSPTP